MLVLADRHHSGLYRSLQLLGARLGWDLWTPVGMDWWDARAWDFGRKTWGDDRLARQFLDGSEWWEDADSPYWTASDPEFPGAYIRGVPLDVARRMRWDLVIATAEDNQWPFAAFARGVGARFAVQVGNTGQHVDWSLDPLALVTSEVPIRGRGVRYHQEMDPLASAWHEPGDWLTPTVASFVNCFGSTPCHGPWREAQALLPGWTFHEHGIDGACGVLKPIGTIADRMASSLFGWHCKIQGDGFGHVIHGWAAVGRPIVGHASHYRGRLAEHLWRHGETCIDLDRVTVPEAARMMRDIAADPDRHAEMCHAIRREYERIDHHAEAEAIRALLRGDK